MVITGPVAECLGFQPMIWKLDKMASENVRHTIWIPGFFDIRNPDTEKAGIQMNPYFGVPIPTVVQFWYE